LPAPAQAGKRRPVRRGIAVRPTFGNRQNLLAVHQFGIERGQLIEQPALSGLDATGQLRIFLDYFERRRVGCRLRLRELQVPRGLPLAVRHGGEAGEQSRDGWRPDVPQVENQRFIGWPPYRAAHGSPAPLLPIDRDRLQPIHWVSGSGAASHTQVQEAGAGLESGGRLSNSKERRARRSGSFFKRHQEDAYSRACGTAGQDLRPVLEMLERVRQYTMSAILVASPTR
jgi:hypothetical protein